ncbi:hypothetical protein EGI97_14560 [Stutzerimonas xanthomarina]|nr:hypothetical protein EGI97_14560 [Stutzerimonas xanthomarina]
MVPAQTYACNAALSSARSAGCALHGASLFLVWPRKSNQKEGHPDIRVLLRKTSLAPALLRRSSRRAIPGPSLLARHPCLVSPCAAPTLGLLKGIRDRVVCKFIDSGRPLRSFTSQKSARRCRTPLSGGRMESAWRGVSGMDAARGLGVPAIKGHGWPLYAGPRNVDEMREVSRSETRMQGQAFLLTFFATEKSESPSRAKPAPHTGTTSGSHLQTRKPTSFAVKTAPTSLTSDATTRCTSQASGSPLRPHTMSLSPCA